MGIVTSFRTSFLSDNSFMFTSPTILTLGDTILTEPCESVILFDKDLRRLAANMRESMLAVEGVGLAANQIGVKKQVFVYRCPTAKGIMEGVVVNPHITFPEGSQRELVNGPEGCLSIPGEQAIVPRYRTVILAGVDLQGNPISPIVASDLLARCFQHEMDHLNGLLYVDRLTRSARRDVLTAYCQSGKGTNTDRYVDRKTAETN